MATTNTAAPKKAAGTGTSLKATKPMAAARMMSGLKRRLAPPSLMFRSARGSTPKPLHGARQRPLPGLQNQDVAGAQDDLSKPLGDPFSPSPYGQKRDPILLLEAQSLG